MRLFAVFWLGAALFNLGFITGDVLTSFPEYFQFGSASASYQVEGGWNEDGKGENIWDRLTHTRPELVLNQDNGDVATDSYHKYKEDVQMLKNAGMNFYRFSISWSRILPNGDTSFINELGIQYYNNLINELLANQIEPMVTIYHWDLPQPLQEIGGMTNPEIIWYFEQYADIVFERFGDRVKTWITFNEPQIICDLGYGDSILAPLVKSPGVGVYLCAQNLLLANAKMYDLYKQKYSHFGARVGISLQCNNFIPKNASETSDVQAAERGFQFSCGLYAHPIFSAIGGYPKIVKDLIDARSKSEGRPWSRLPEMAEEEKQLIKGKADFFGLNYYFTAIAEPANPPNYQPGLSKDREIVTSFNQSWPRAQSKWLFSYPDGLRQFLNKLRTEYNNPEVVITENGWSDDGDLQDVGRIEYYKGHLSAVLDAINEGCNVTAHTAWSIMDNFEWINGYSERFGLYHVDYSVPERTRTPKASVNFLRNVIRTRQISN